MSPGTIIEFNFWEIYWSGRRDSNPRLQPWQGCALPLSYARLILISFDFLYFPIRGVPLGSPIGKKRNQ